MARKLSLGGVALLALLGTWWVVGSSPDDGPPVVEAASRAEAAPSVEEPPVAAAEPPVRRPRVRVTPPANVADAPAAPTGGSVAKRLAQPLERVQFDGVSLEECCARLTAGCGVPIVIAGEVLEGHHKDELQVSLRLGSPAAVKSVLDLLTRLRSLSWVVDADRVVITPASGEWDRSRVVVPAPWTGDDEPR